MSETKTMQNDELLTLLKLSCDEKYRLFSIKLGNCQTPFIGVRSPILDRIGKEIIERGEDLSSIPFHQYVETDQLIGSWALRSLKSNEEKYEFLDRFLPGIDSWVVIDSLGGHFATDDYRLGLARIKKYTKSKDPFTRRFAYIHFMKNFVQKEKLPDLFKIMAPDEHYYVRMGEAWLLCECFIHFPQDTEKYFSDNQLDDWTINKAISKIHDSFRVGDSDKKHLEKYRRRRRKVSYNNDKIDTSGENHHG